MISIIMSIALGMALLPVAWTHPAQDSTNQAASNQEKVAALKASLESSAKLLKDYVWTETVVVKVSGEEKSRQLNRCSWSADGKLQKEPLAPQAEEKQKKGVRGKIIEGKKEEMSAYMKEAVEVIKLYFPPDPEKILKAKEAGKIAFQPLPDQKLQLTISDYAKPGDSFQMVVGTAAVALLEARVASTMESDKAPVTLNAKLAMLADGATHVDNVTLDASGKKIVINIINSDYRKAGK